MGGPLQLVLVFVATLMGVVSQVALGGYNEVMVAANTVIYGQFLFVALAPLALAPLAEAWILRPTVDGPRRKARIPWPLIWTGALVLVLAVLLATAYGHLTWQFTAFVTTLWATTFLVASRVPRAALLTSLVVAAGMTVWLPMNAIAVVLIVGWLVYLVAHGVRGRGWDFISLGLVVVVAVAIWEPIRSSLAFVLASTPTAAEAVVGGFGGGVRAAVGVVAAVPGFGWVGAGLSDSTLFEAGGGTEQTTAIVAGIAAVAAVARRDRRLAAGHRALGLRPPAAGRDARGLRRHAERPGPVGHRQRPALRLVQVHLPRRHRGQRCLPAGRAAAARQPRPPG